MKIMKFVLIFSIFCLGLLSLSSCVGTIQDADSTKTIGAGEGSEKGIDYAGILSARAIAHDKVEIFFPVAEGDPDELAYVIRYDGQQIPLYIFGSSLRPDYRGQLRATVKNLNISSNYVFSVQVREIKKGVESNNSVNKLVKTFNNVTSNFDGVSELRHLSGAAGTTGIEVHWNPAEVRGTVINKDEIDPIEYKVTIIDGAALNPGSMNNAEFTEPQRKIITASSDKRKIVVNGLSPDRKYYVQVRAIHHGTTVYGVDPNYKKEENTNYLEISTYSDDVGDIDFADSSYQLSYPQGSGGLYSLNAKWAAPTGNFDHYRIYYTVKNTANLNNYLNLNNQDTQCLGAETADSNVRCYFVGPSLLNTTLSELNPYVEYDTLLVICLSVNCEAGKRRITEVRSMKTAPPVAQFDGITRIDGAININELDRMFLHFSLPVFSTGNISGYYVKYYGSDPSSTPVIINNPNNSSGLTIGNYSLTTSTSIEVIGIDPTSQSNYCFKVVPYIVNLDNSITEADESTLPVSCRSPGITGPTIADFSGFENFSCNVSNGQIILNWNAPLTGVYSHYQIFYQNTLPDFSYGAAIDSGNSAYTRLLVNPSLTSYTLSGLQAGTTYRVGILTYFLSSNGIIRSEFNTGFISCSL